jgi:cytidylate kinase
LEHKSDGGEPAGLHSEGSEVTVVALDFFSPIFMYLKTMNDAQGIIPILRSEANGNAASRLSTNPCVREFINCAIREFAKNVDLVIDGRDTTTVLFPKASVKLFVTASLEKRAVRRFLEDNKEVRAISPQELQAYMTIMKDRDIRDSSRKVAPLVQANDAIVIDTSDMTISMACDTAFSVVNGKLHRI